MKRIALLPVCLLLKVLSSPAQSFEAALDSFSRNAPVEKLYLHYDKELYVAGETIWFKAYLYSDGKPSGISNTMFIQLADASGRLVSVNSYPIQGAVARGNINLPDSLPQGTYCLRAFTPYTAGHDEDFIYKKNISLFRPAPASTAKEGTEQFSVQFFPESGEMVDGILCVVGFKALNQSGMPVQVNGTVRTEDGTTIASFAAQHDGMGRVRFRPAAGKKYIAEAEAMGKAGVLKKTFSLPDVKMSGINLHVDDEKGGKKFILSRGEQNKSAYDNLWIVAEVNQHVVYETEIAFEDYPSVVGHLVTDSLPSGILHFTVFNKDRIPLAERLTFVNNGEYRGDAEINIEKESSSKRGENSLRINFPAGLRRSCSVSVTDASTGTGAEKETIWSRLLLTADLKGVVHNPAWYFSNPADTVKAAIDNLLLTQGWSRFSWKKIMAGGTTEKKTDGHYFQKISGQLVDEKSRQPVEGGLLSIYLEGEDSVSQNFELLPDADGRFRIDSLLFYGKTQMYYAWQDKKGKRKMTILIPDQPLNAAISNYLPPGIEKNISAFPRGFSYNNAEINSRYDYMQSLQEEVRELERITIQSRSSRKPEEVVNEKYAQGVFRAQSKVMLDNINEPVSDKSLNAVDYIKNRVQQIELQGQQFVSRKNFSLGSGAKWPVGIFINEVPVDLDQLRLLRTGEIAMVKFFDAGFVGGGSSSPGGTLAVYTRQEGEEKPPPEELKMVTLNGYSIVKQFYNPDYSIPEKKQSSFADRRTTLYWNPDVFSDDKANEFRITFYNNDISKRFRIVLEGFDETGKLIHEEKITGTD